jgi:GNAT superfamily N-acetyltransferase
MTVRMRFEARALTPETWPDMEELFDARGTSITRYCWCMYYRYTGKETVPEAVGATTREQLRSLVTAGVVPGLIGYVDSVPSAWVSLGPREDYLKLRRSSVMKPVDDTPVWSVVCFYVPRAARGTGLTHRMLAAAMDHAREHGVRMLEAYPVDKQERSQDDFMFFGSRSLYERAGFREVERRSPTRVVMRRGLRPKRT